MAISNDAARRRAAEAAAKKAAEAATKKVAAKKPTRTFAKDELSKGLGRALRERATQSLGASGLASARGIPAADSTAKSVAAAKAALSKLSAADAKKTDVVFLKDTRPGAPVDSGTVLLRRDGRFTEPVTGKSFDSLARFDSERAYAPAGTAKAADLLAVLKAPTGTAVQRAAYDKLNLDPAAKAMLPPTWRA